MNAFKTFEINWKKLVFQLLPSFLRHKNLWAYAYAAIGNAVTLDSRTDKYIKSAVYRLSHTPKKIHIQKVLNDHFDRQQRRIAIENIRNTEPIWFANRIEDKPVWFPRRTPGKAPGLGASFFRPSDYREGDADFLVCLPAALKPVHKEALGDWLSQIKGQVDYYKEPDKKYRIKWTD